MNELAFGLFGRLQADRYVRVSVVDLRRLRCDRVVMKLLFRGSLISRLFGSLVPAPTFPSRSHASTTPDARYEELVSSSWNLLVDLYKKVLDCRPADIIQCNSSRRGYAILRTRTYRRVLAHWLLGIQISRSRSHHAPFDRLAPQRQQKSRISTAPA